MEKDVIITNEKHKNEMLQIKLEIEHLGVLQIYQLLILQVQYLKLI